MKIILICLILVLFSCNKTNSEIVKQETQVMKINDKDSLRNILKKQILNGYAIKEKGLDAFSEYNYSINDYDIIADISLEILKKNNIKILDKNEFDNKILEIFRFKKDKNLINFLIEYPCSKENYVYQLDENYAVSNNNPIFIDRKRKILTEALFIPELIDYKKDFPDIFEKEKTISKEKKLATGDVVEVIRWGDLTTLEEKRSHNIQILTNRNKYLFNDNKASFSWLQFHDQIFLESLIKTFGFVKDQDLLAWYIKRNGIEKYNNNLEEYLRIFYIKTCDKQFHVHQETFSYMDKNPLKYSQEILNILEDIRTETIKLENLSFQEKAKLIANLLYFGEKHKQETGLIFSFIGSFYEHSSEDLKNKYEEEFKKNNFYSLPNFENFWNDAKADGDGVGLDM